MFSSNTGAAVLILIALFPIVGKVTAQDAPMDQSAMDHSSMDHSKIGQSSMPSTPSDEMPAAHGGGGHGDHNPRFGGLVLMYGGLLHFELVGRPEGGVELHLSDEMRVPMPALTVTDVTVEIERPDGSFESVSMSLSEAGDFWRGQSAPLTDQEQTTVHLAFVAFGDPYVYALPLAALQPDTSAGRSGTDAATLALGPQDAAYAG
ncbi:MAG: hypothetical protein AAGI72_24490 [Pseudomonadota bacterium]